MSDKDQTDGGADGTAAAGGAAAPAAAPPETVTAPGSPPPSLAGPAAPDISPPTYTASLFPAQAGTVSTQFVKLVKELEEELEMPIWCLVHGGRPGSPEQLDVALTERFIGARKEFEAGQHIGLLIDSPGGHAEAAFQLASLLRRRCGGFTAIIPRYAKSAATLLTIGADEILMYSEAELGPLDAQVLDEEGERWMSALDEVQALERLLAFQLKAMDDAMMVVMQRTGKKPITLLPSVLEFTVATTRPLLEKIDTVHHTQMQRVLKIGEEYAARLLSRNGKMKPDEARRTAMKLVFEYPSHDFVIDMEEARSKLRLPICHATEDVNELLGRLRAELSTDKIAAVGRLHEKVK